MVNSKTMAELFNVKVNTINYHLKEVFNSNELIEDSVVRRIRITALDELVLESKNIES